MNTTGKGEDAVKGPMFKGLNVSEGHGARCILCLHVSRGLDQQENRFWNAPSAAPDKGVFASMLSDAWLTTDSASVNKRTQFAWPQPAARANVVNFRCASFKQQPDDLYMPVLSCLACLHVPSTVQSNEQRGSWSNSSPQNPFPHASRPKWDPNP